MQEPYELRWNDSKITLWCVKWSYDYATLYETTCKFGIYVYIDSDWVGNETNYKSTSGYFFNLGKVPFVVPIEIKELLHY